MEHDELTIPRPFRPVRCAIYTRQSVVRSETEELTSCTVQRELCERHIRSRRMEGWYTLPERFDDEGASGASAERSALNRLLEKIEAGVVDRVVVYSLDRITRRLLDWAEMLALFERHGVKLSIAKGELSESDLLTSQLAMNVLASLAEFERGLIRERLLEARAAKRQHGLRSAGLLPFGFTSAPATRQLKPLASECELVRRVFERAAAGAKPVEIATWLNQQGIATKKSGQVGGKPWTARAVLRVIGNRVYLGEIGGVRAAHDAVIDGDLFEKANATVGARRTRAPNRTRVDEKDDPFLLRGKVRCIHCGRAMTTATGKQKHKRATPRRFYRCRGIVACRGTQVIASDLEHSVLLWLQAPKRRQLSAEAGYVLSTMKPLWRVFLPPTLRLIVQKLVAEVRWDGRREEFQVVLDESALRLQAAEFRKARSAAS